MIFFRQIREHRPTVVLVFLVVLSLVSLITGTRASVVHTGIKRAVSLTAYPFLKAKALTEDSASYMVDFVFAYDAQRRRNTVLTQEVIELKRALAHYRELRTENRRLRRMLDFVREEPRLYLEPVRVIESMKGMLTIDRGRLHGIRESMSVLAVDGVVGMITDVSDVTAKVATIHHMDCKVGAMVERNRIRAYDGIIHAGSDLTNICTMDYIDVKDDVRKGDLVVTSPESLFPSGYPIGVVSAVHGSDSLWKWAEIVPAVDPYKLDEVFVVHRASGDAERLAGPPLTVSAEEQLAATAGESTQVRAIQERYAP